jgi:hypothetical protein
MSHTVEVHAFIIIDGTHGDQHVCGWKTITLPIVPMSTNAVYIQIQDWSFEVQSMTIRDSGSIELDVWIDNAVFPEDGARALLEDLGFNNIKCCGQVEERILA